MPFRATTQDGVLTSEDLNFLQQVYDTAAATTSNIDDAAMHDTVRILIGFYQAGERNRIKLVALAARELRHATSRSKLLTVG
jgi:hypothetical protein